MTRTEKKLMGLFDGLDKTIKKEALELMEKSFRAGRDQGYLEGFKASEDRNVKFKRIDMYS